MCLKILQTLLGYTIMYVIAFEDIIYAYDQISDEMVEQGRVQYQLLQARGSLPKYGNCWKSATEHVEEGCRYLSEETQSDMALHMTNCFLEMSGHETYNCELDKKPNLRAICIQSMTDRAFNVYTEFYTHTQNICWFLRGQVWHETIVENTLRVGKQLESSSKNQEKILRSQEESLALQEKLLRDGQNLEKLMENFYISTKEHQQVLSVMSTSLRNLQSWLVGEISWFDLIVFYVIASILIVVFTSSSRTAEARFPIWFLLVLTALTERAMCTTLISNAPESAFYSIQKEMYKYVWWLRKAFIALALLILMYKAYTYKNMMYVNNNLLQRIYDQNVNITERLAEIQGGRGSHDHNFSNGHINYLDENSSRKSFRDLNCNGSFSEDYKVNNFLKDTVKTHKKLVLNDDINILRNNLNIHKTEEPKTTKDCPSKLTARQRISPFLQGNDRYNLRSRHGTPDSNI